MNPNISLLLDIVKYDSSFLDRNTLESINNADWESIYILAGEQCIHALLQQRLKDKGLEDLAPVSILDRLKRHYRINALRNMKLLGELSSIVARFHDEDIPVIALKGAHLAGVVYGNVALREVGDMDLMVPAEKLSQADDSLKSLGYASKLNHEVPVEVSLAASHHLPCMMKPGCFDVELHATITRPLEPYAIAMDELWQRSVHIRLGNARLRGLSAEDLLLHICMHTSYQHRFEFSLRPSFDIAVIIQHAEDGFDWRAVCERAGRWGWQRGVYLALRASRDLLGAAVPAEVLDSLCGDPRRDDLFLVAKEQIFTNRSIAKNVSHNLAELWGQTSFLGRLRRFWDKLFLPPPVMASLYPVSPHSMKRYWYYLVRLRDILGRYAGTTWSLYQKDQLLSDIAFRKYALDQWLDNK